MLYHSRWRDPNHEKNEAEASVVLIHRACAALIIYSSGHFYLFVITLFNNWGLAPMAFELGKKDVRISPVLQKISPAHLANTGNPGEAGFHNASSSLEQFEISPWLAEWYFSFTNPSLFMLLTLSLVLLLLHFVTKNGRLSVIKWPISFSFFDPDHTSGRPGRPIGRGQWKRCKTKR